jgi:hypothetical protein
VIDAFVNLLAKSELGFERAKAAELAVLATIRVT